MAVVGPIAAKKLQGRECSEVPDRTPALQENSLVISIKSSTQTDTNHFAERELRNIGSG
jgi:hypothetical protein